MLKPIERELITMIMQEIADAREWKTIETALAAWRNVRAIIDARVTKQVESDMADEMRRMQNRT